ncbi:MAG: D-alanine--D-alanine ligase [Verrucomicrobia bacterium]|nr:D-alanine--D-alanine ligase [Verrucomicrobiota bacterium]
MKPEKMKVAVLAGGVSGEREVSQRSGAAVAKALRSVGVRLVEVDVKVRGVEVPQGTDICFLCLHGVYGEDGTLQAELDAKGIAYTGSGAIASALAFDKLRAKEAMASAGVAQPEGMAWTKENDWLPPYVLKPVADGSSLGVHLVRTAEEAKKARKEAAKWKGAMMIERLIEGAEMTIGILGEQALPVVEVRPGKGFYDYRNKYTTGATQYICPAQISKEKAAELQEMALQAHRALGCEVLSRVDVMVDAEGKAAVLEVNTIPGMTDLSLLPKAGQAAGIEFSKLCLRVLELSWARNRKGVQA